jgi:cob(I)alamin adenosyltransferase
MHCAAILASGPGANTEKMVPPTAFDIEILEKEIDNMESELEKLSSFVLPGGSIEVSEIHICRTVCRRAERSILRASTSVDVDPLIIKYINRLSDFMFVLARKVAKESGNEQLKWIP